MLVVAGSLKRSDRNRPEEQVLMRALRDFNIPKIVTDDLPVFMGLIGDLFPATDVPRKRDLDFEATVKKSALVSIAVFLYTLTSPIFHPSESNCQMHLTSFSPDSNPVICCRMSLLVRYVASANVCEMFTLNARTFWFYLAKVAQRVPMHSRHSNLIILWQAFEVFITVLS